MKKPNMKIDPLRLLFLKITVESLPDSWFFNFFINSLRGVKVKPQINRL